MTRAQLLNRSWYAALLWFAAALVAALLGSPAALTLGLIGAAHATLLPVVWLLAEEPIRAWLAACPRYRAVLAERARQEATP